MEEEKLRADVALTKRGLAASREKAQALIAAGLVRLNGETLGKSSVKVGSGDALAVLGADHPYVSRGGLKLEKALREFSLAPGGMVCVDIGASTGGFTDVLLRNGARHVYAVDVGTGQLDRRLANDPRVTNLEHVNARALPGELFPLRPQLAVMDVSFISIRLILPAALPLLGANGRMITLIKPQFEAGREAIGKRGLVTKPAIHARVLREIVDFVSTLRWQVQALTFSPIAGGDGNLEFLADLVPEERSEKRLEERDIARLVALAHAAVPLK